MGFLEDIIARKREEVQELQGIYSHAELENANARNRSKDFYKALRVKRGAIIAEVKRQSPSKGKLAEIKKPIELVLTYVEGGANVISVLTDSAFAGSPNDLKEIAAAFPSTPVLRKDFIVDESQLYQSVALGASGVLLIVRVLGNETPKFITLCESLGLGALVEAHTVDEAKKALHWGAKAIGINARDLESFQIDTDVWGEFVSDEELMKAEVIKIAESGITSPQQARALFEMGFNALLIGEALVKEKEPRNFIKQAKIQE